MGRYSRRKAGEPWLLAVSPTLDTLTPEQVVSLYTKRMSIEEAFRDLKSHRWGFAARYARSSCMQRIEVLLLLSTLATFVLWLSGLATQSNHWAARFQANTERKRPVLSTVFLGWRALHAYNMRCPKRDWQLARRGLQRLVTMHTCPA